MRHFWPEFRSWLDEVPDSRFQPFVVYDRRFLLWWGLSLFLTKLGSRRQLDFDLRDEESEVLANLNRLANTEQETLPVHDTLDHFIGHVRASPIADLRAKMIRRLIRMKALDECRLLGRFVLAVDGTGHLAFSRRHCPHCLVQKHAGKTVYLHEVLEAKLVSPAGLALSVGTEFIENPADPPSDGPRSKERRKQDSELNALSRLAPGLKRDFPRTSFCLTADNLFACGRAIQLAADNAWSYIYVFKRTHMPAVWRDYQSLLELAPENRLQITYPDGTKRLYRWVNGLSYQDDQRRTHTFDAFQCHETCGGKTKFFAWITDIRVTAKNVDTLATKGGRPRWKIENQGFKAQKTSELNLEHAYSTNPEKIKAYYYLLQIAHTILQLLEKGDLVGRLAHQPGKSPMEIFGTLKRIAARLLECLRRCRLPDAAYVPRPAIRIRLAVT